MAGVVIVHFVSTLVAGYSNFVSVQNDDVITGIYVRSVFRFVLTAQATSQFSSQTAQSLPVASTTYQSRFTVLV
ncbi:Uncharacterised protein [Salmonella enterica subsp. enterica]|uniref:Uncharacterized protein n=1 Tax=Salmonella enterica I TaxID=59201 RepID=A0A379W1Y9_SALET|nr:Uncharacterised protein [Salmonella enterica subsp. enterica]